jgi:hypothetical protein
MFFGVGHKKFVRDSQNQNDVEASKFYVETVME